MRIITTSFINGFWFIVLLVISSNVVAVPSKSVWKDVGLKTKAIDESNSTLSKKPKALPLKFRALKLDEFALKQILIANSPSATNTVYSEKTAPVISVPLPQGGEISLKLEEASVMAPELAQEFPEIKTWRAKGIDAHIKGRIDFTMHGFHAMLTMPDGDTVFIEPDKASGSDKYISFNKRLNASLFNTDFKCSVHSDIQSNSALASKIPVVSERLLARPASDLISYRLAVAATGEYTQFHGGNKTDALSAIITTINRVNGIMERDLSISLQLIPEQLDIIYTDPETDPYTNSDAETLLLENKLNFSGGDLRVDLFDIGHVFTSGSIGGLANVGSVCGLSKAGGVSGISFPLGDAFSVDYVAHEIGHQLGATHTFNSVCIIDQRTAETAVEPGSGTTIMSYAGLCGLNNIENFVNPQFHAVSINQILNYSRFDTGSTCSSNQIVSNENPEADAGPDFIVPARTPFRLFGQGSDLDGDILSYTWEQSDTGTATNVDVDAGNNAIFRSRPPLASGTRYIPRLSDLFRGIPVTGERLPVTNRNVEFVMTVRDDNGGVQSDIMNMQVYDTGSAFRVTSHVTSTSFEKGVTTDVTWDVAGTEIPPISCENVVISLISLDGNSIFLASTENDGLHTVTMPDEVETLINARIMVACTNNLFFNVSSGASDSAFNLALFSSGGGSLGYLGFIFLGIAILRRKLISNSGLWWALK